VQDFVYLGSNIHEDGDIFHEIKSRINLANKTYFSPLPIFKSTNVHRAKNTKLYKTRIRTTLYCGCETWTVNRKSEMAIDSFERNLLRRIWGPVKDNDRWR
jgi:hypothetical protein